MPRPKIDPGQKAVRFTITIPRHLVEQVDALFQNRSAAIARALVLYLAAIQQARGDEVAKAQEKGGMLS